MAYTPHTLVAIGGLLNEKGTNDEIFEVTIRGFSGNGGSPASGVALADPAAYVAQVGPKVVTWWQSINNCIPAAAKLTYVKANNVGADGKYSDDVTHGFYPANPVGGGSTLTVAAPSFCSVATSWTTAKARGRAARGRIYLPNFAASLNLGGSSVSQSSITSILNAGLTLLDALGNNGGVEEFQPSVVSRIDGSYQAITGVRVGNVYDVQRRRKYAVPETYVTAGWPVP